MSSRSREKIALVVFVILIVLSACALVWYLIVGHSWNVAASNIDDTFGSMDGYTAIIYPGTNLKKPETGKGTEQGNAASGNAAGVPASQGAGDTTANQDKDDAAMSSGQETSNDSASSVGADDSVAHDARENVVRSATSSEPDNERSFGVDEVEESYEDKSATVFALDTADAGQYQEATILKKGNHRFGVFSVNQPLSNILLEKQIAYFKRYKVDFIVAITSNKDYVKGVNGIDIVLCTQDAELFVTGETVNGTFYVATPEVGEVGAILISPSNVVSAKVVQKV